MSRPDPALPTAVIGSYSMPGWLERAKNDYLHRRLSRHDLDEIHDAAVKAAIKDQEAAGSRRRLRRRAAPGQHDRPLHDPAARACRSTTPRRSFYYDFYDCAVRGPPAHRVAGPGRGVPVPPPLHRAPRQGLGDRPPLAGQAHPQRVLPERGSPRPRPRPRHEPRAAGAGPGGRHGDPDRRAVLLGLPRGPAVGGPGAQRAGRGRRGPAVAPRLLREPLRQALVGRELPLPVPGHPGRPDQPAHAGVRPAGRGRRPPVQGVRSASSRSGSASSTSRATTSRRRRSSPSGSARPSTSSRPSGSPSTRTAA